MRDMQTIVTDVCGVCPSVCLSHGLSQRCLQCVQGSFGAVFAKLLWPLVIIEKNLILVTFSFLCFFLINFSFALLSNA